MSTLTTEITRGIAPLTNLPRRALATLGAWGAELARRRATLGQMRRLDARSLRDIGLTPGDLDAATHQPLSRDASDALYRASLGRAGQW